MAECKHGNCMLSLATIRKTLAYKEWYDNNMKIYDNDKKTEFKGN